MYWHCKEKLDVNHSWELKDYSGFQSSDVKPKPNQLLTNYTSQPITNQSKTKTKVIT